MKISSSQAWGVFEALGAVMELLGGISAGAVALVLSKKLLAGEGLTLAGWVILAASVTVFVILFVLVVLTLGFASLSAWQLWGACLKLFG